MANDYEDDEDTTPTAADPSLGIFGILAQMNTTTPEARQMSRKILNDELDGTPYKAEQGILAQMEKNAETARQSLREARAQLLKQRYSPADAWLAAGQAFGTPTRTGAFGETAGNVAGAIREPLRKRDEFNRSRDANVLNLDQALSSIDQGMLGNQLELAKLQRSSRSKLSVEALKTLGKGSGNHKMPEGPKAVDKAYANDYVDFIQTGASDAAKGLEELTLARDKLRSKTSDTLTGPIVGTIAGLPGVGKTIQDVAFPESSDVQETVEYTIQRSLRPILGAQFTKEEGERLISRVYNPRLKEEVNAKRLDRLIKQLERAYQEKSRAAHYFEQNGTLTGFTGKTSWSVDDFVPSNSTGSPAAPKQKTIIKFEDLPDVKPNFNDPALDGLTPEEKVGANTPARARGGRVGFAEGGKVGIVNALVKRYHDVIDLFNSGNLTRAQERQLEKESEALADELEKSGIDFETLATEVDSRGTYKDQGLKEPDFIPKREYAEGGSVDEVELITVQMPDGSTLEVAPDSTKAEVQELYKRKKRGNPTVNMAPPVPEEKAEPDTGLSSLLGMVDPEAGATVAGGSTLGYLAGKYGLGAGQGISDLVPGRRIKSSEKPVLKALEDDNINPSDVVSNVKQARKRGTPSMVADEGGPGISALTESVLTRPNPDIYQMLKDLEKRQDNSRDRVTDRVNNSLAPDEYFSQEKKLFKERSANAGPMYDAAEKQFPAVKSQELMKLMKTPSGRKAVKEAVRSIQDKPGATIGRADAMGMVRRPSLEFLNQVKIELDDMIKKEEGSGASYNPTARGSRLRDLRNAFVGEIDTATTVKGRSPYKAARETYQGDSKLIEALQSGRDDFLKREPAELGPIVANMSASEKDNLRSGVAQRLFEMVRNPTTDTNPATKVIGSPGMEERLSLLFDKPKDFQLFKAALEGEQAMYDQTKRFIQAGKRSRPRHSNTEASAAQKVSDKVPALAWASPVHWMMKYLKEKPEIPDKALPDLVATLRSGDPAALQAFEKNFGAKFGRTARRAVNRGRAGKVGIAAGAVTALSKLLGDNEEEVEDPGYAEGGKVGLVQQAIARLSALMQGEQTSSTGVEELLEGLRNVLGVPGEQREAIHRDRMLTDFTKEQGNPQRSAELQERLLSQLAEVYLNPDVKHKARGGYAQSR